MSKHLPQIDPKDFVDWFRWYFKLKSDREVGAELGLSPPAVSKLRHRSLPVGATLLVRVLELTDTKLRDLPKLIMATKPLWGTDKESNPDRGISLV